MFEIIFLFFVSLYFLIAATVIVGISKRWKKLNNYPSVSIVVAARNEEMNIERCLNSLVGVEYERSCEIIIVDDHSTDSTFNLATKFISEYKGEHRIRVIKSSGVGGLKGKPAALDTGIRGAENEVIMTTDADCVVGSDWVETIASYYSENTGAVNGFTIIEGNGAVPGIQTNDIIFLLTIASGLINIGYPVSSIGNNMSFRKEAYIKTGGFIAEDFSLTEDAQLLKKIGELKEYEIKYPLDKGSIIKTGAINNIKELIEQKKRWGAGSRGVSWYGKIVLAVSYFTNLCMAAGVLFFSEVWLYLAVFKITIDFLLVYPVFKKLGETKQINYFLLFQLYLILYITLIPILIVISRKITWKGRDYASSM
jgi:cellulose synthase/poly-beta-1,6-N-acetylglucosamine synthase-like glycosyltransferase